MATEIRVPTLGESVTEATIGKWFKKPGDAIKADEPLVELETDKVTLEVNAPAAGVLGEITAKEGETVGVNALLGMIAAGGAAAVPSAAPAAKPEAVAHLLLAPQPLRKPKRRQQRLPVTARSSQPPRPAIPAPPLQGLLPRAASIRQRAGNRQGWPRHQGRHACGHCLRIGCAGRRTNPRRAPSAARGFSRR